MFSSRCSWYLIRGLYNHVIYVDLKVLSYFIGKHSDYPPLVCGVNFFDARGLVFIIIIVIVFHGEFLERLEDPSWFGLTGVGINETHHLVP